ncbi:MAG TPA: alpha/beta hydrolase [Streptosporangiaceae bacterium]|nr:alpha/beta hydrolase [Streptosporangiaceae bacterium]
MSTPRPVLFIHGLFLHATSFTPWIEMFATAGYDPSAPGWPGDPATVQEARDNSDAMANHGIDDVVDHYAKIITGLDAKPIVIGHSFGGLIAQKLLGQDLAAAAVGIDSAQIKGVLPLPLSALKVTTPVFKNPANRHKTVMLTARQFKYAFGNALTEEESDELYARWAIPAPGKPLFEAASANFRPHSPAKVSTDNETRGPLLLIMGGQDHTSPEVITKSTMKQYKHSAAETDLLEFPDRSHSLTIDHGWREVADAVMTWLHQREL